MFRVTENGEGRQYPVHVGDFPEGTLFRGTITDDCDGKTYRGVWLRLNEGTFGGEDYPGALLIDRQFKNGLLFLEGNLSIENFQELDGELKVWPKKN